MSACFMQPGRSTLMSAPDVRDSITDSTQIRDRNVVAKAYVPEETVSFAVKVEIIREVSIVRSPNDFGKSRV